MLTIYGGMLKYFFFELYFDHPVIVVDRITRTSKNESWSPRKEQALTSQYTIILKHLRGCRV